MKKILFGGENISSPLANFGLFVLRVFAGLALAFGHGIKKFPPSERFISGVADLGFPLPDLFAWFASFAELGCGILLAIGLFSRPSALLIAATMATAGFLSHADDPFATKEKAFLYLAISLLFLFIGGGKYALDRAFKK